ncbi:MAG: hypothetical protein KY469_02170 [Actinobacteria bacterium]|nr:hypothetical protein [Actinomycetota bacterium]
MHHSGLDLGGANNNREIHPDLANPLRTDEFDCVTSGSSCAQTATPFNPWLNHATSVAGVAAATTNNRAAYPDAQGGMASVGYDTDYISYRVLEPEQRPDGTFADPCRSRQNGGFCLHPRPSGAPPPVLAAPTWA